MKYNIKKLKDLRIAYECAINYDYVPNESEAKELIEFMLPKHINISTHELEEILKKYEGNSVGNIIDMIISLIDKL